MKNKISGPLSIIQASVLSIGTELTYGQIANTNATWISHQLKEIGILTQLHLTVPDQRSVIQLALNHVTQYSNLIFVTGGLGPTSDDITREMIAQWIGLPLEFDSDSWDSIVERLTLRNYPVRESQKQQCFFPQGSVILRNSRGTANGFYIESKGKKIFVLPGPPKEIEIIWNEWIKDALMQTYSAADHFKTFSWDTMGVGESEIARITEQVILRSDFESELEIGYRVHMPYVEVKASYFKSKEPLVQPWIQKLEEALLPFTYTRQGEDLAQLVSIEFAKFPRVHILDRVSGGYLFRRLLTYSRDLLDRNKINFLTSPTGCPLNSKDFELDLSLIDSLNAVIRWTSDEQKYEQILETPYKSEHMVERRQQLWAELSLFFILKQLKRIPG